MASNMCFYPFQTLPDIGKKVATLEEEVAKLDASGEVTSVNSIETSYLDSSVHNEPLCFVFSLIG